MKKLVISNRKGGVGKTTLSTHLAYYAHELGLKVLFINNDTQLDSGFSLSNVATQTLDTLSLYTEQVDFSQAIEDNCFVLFKGVAGEDVFNQDNFDCFEANINTASEYFDLCIFDTPPTKGDLQDFPMLVSEFVLSPIEIEQYSFLGIDALMDRVVEIQAANPNITFLGFIPNKVMMTNVSHKEGLKQLQKDFSQYLFGKSLYVPLRSSIQEANGLKIPVWKIKKTTAREAGRLIKKLNKEILKAVGVI